MNKNELSSCPICDKKFSLCDIEKHVNKCIFLNCSTDTHDNKSKRKRSPSPVIFNNSQSLKSNIGKESKGFLVPQSSKSKDLEASCSTKMDKDLTFAIPLAKQLQPKTFDDLIGQDQILGPNTVLRLLLEKCEIPNMILWGPPGSGKTSLAGVIQELSKIHPNKLKFVSVCATTCGVKEVQNVIADAKLQLKFGRRTILFMDEIHRFNKKQQDTFLLNLERGDIILIGATTENPSFYINSALLSRCRVIVFKKLESDSLYSILAKAAKNFDIDVIDLDNLNDVNMSKGRVTIDTKALKWLADISDGDARIALSNLQMTLQHNNNKSNVVKIENIKEGIQKCHLLYDRKGEEHYNIISAVHKSIRGSDVNAALYWTARMIKSGEDPLFIARRFVRAASEDIGNADPNALPLAVAAMHGCQLLGMPEADVLLAQCAIYLARAPKSREADSALAEAKRVISEWTGPQPEVPLHLRNAPTRLMKDLGYGKLKLGEELSFMPLELKNKTFLN